MESGSYCSFSFAYICPWAWSRVGPSTQNMIDVASNNSSNNTLRQRIHALLGCHRRHPEWSSIQPLLLSLSHYSFSLSPLPLSSSLILTHPFPIDQSSPPLHLTLTLFPSLPPMSLSPDEEQSSVRKFASLDFHIVVFYSQIHSLCLNYNSPTSILI